MLTNEVFFRDFQNRREVAGYLGLASSPWSSGAVTREHQECDVPGQRRGCRDGDLFWRNAVLGYPRAGPPRIGADVGRGKQTAS